MSVKQPASVDATFYAVVEPKWSQWQKDAQDRPVLTGAAVTKITQGRPGKIAGSAVLTRLTLRVDSAALLPLQPEAIIHIRPGDVEVIEVTAAAPEGE